MTGTRTGAAAPGIHHTQVQGGCSIACAMASAHQSTVLLQAVLTCPACGASTTETMPTDACVYFHQCASCGARFKPKPGDCCVFCSYGTVPCPPVQEHRGCCR